MWKPPLTKLQEELYDAWQNIICVYGARASGKTIGVEHKWLKHLWRNNARVAVITKTNRQGAYGIWPELTEQAYQLWRNAGVGNDKADFKYQREPWRDSINKIEQCTFYNRHGGVSKVVLFPIEDAREARAKLMSTSWSGVWISEGHLYTGRDEEEMAENRQILDTAIAQLRYDPCPMEERMVIVDTNPPDEGTEHWLYPPFFTELEWAKNNEWPEHFTPQMIEAKRRVIERTMRMRMPIESNTFLHPDLKDMLVAQYAHDLILYRRYIGSEWINGTTKGVFSKVFLPHTHVLGQADGPKEEEWEVIPPSNALNVHIEEGLPLILCGWDMGEVNHAWVAVQPVYVRDTMHFRVLDELVVLKDEITIDEFTSQVMDRMKALEKFAGFSVTWKHYSDSSAFEFKAQIKRKDVPLDADLCDAAIVQAVSDGAIMLEGSRDVKQPGWVRRRVAFLSMLLRSKRLLISAHCKGVVEMFRNLKKGDRRSAVDPEHRNKHAFDALSYCVCMFDLEEVMNDPQTAETRRDSSAVHA